MSIGLATFVIIWIPINVTVTVVERWANGSSGAYTSGAIFLFLRSKPRPGAAKRSLLQARRAEVEISLSEQNANCALARIGFGYAAVAWEFPGTDAAGMAQRRLAPNQA
jgi:hypothetical protein